MGKEACLVRFGLAIGISVDLVTVRSLFAAEGLLDVWRSSDCSRDTRNVCKDINPLEEVEGDWDKGE